MYRKFVAASGMKEDDQEKENVKDNSASSLNFDDEINEELKEKWAREQEELKLSIILEDVDDWNKYLTTTDDSNSIDPDKYIGGVDISFVKGDNVNACAALVILRYPDMKVVYEDLSMVELTAPYIPGFLAFREVSFLVEKVTKVFNKFPQFTPQVIFVDGNGILHPKEFGLACQLGVMVNIACIGVAKNLFHVDGLEKNADHHDKINKLTKAGDSFPLIGQSGKLLGVALKSCDSSTNPIYVSPGHKISVETAACLVKQCCRVRVPEPTRQADIRSREYLRVHFLKTEVRGKQKQKKKKSMDTLES